MSILLWIICVVSCYFVIGLITACASVKWFGDNLDKVDAEDIALPLFLWPLIFIFVIGWGICIAVKKLFFLTATYIFKIPTTTPPDAPHDDGGGIFIQHGGGTNPPPTAPKPNVIPPSQKVVEDEDSTPRFNLIDMD